MKGLRGRLGRASEFTTTIRQDTARRRRVNCCHSYDVIIRSELMLCRHWRRWSRRRRRQASIAELELKFWRLANKSRVFCDTLTQNF